MLNQQVLEPFVTVDTTFLLKVMYIETILVALLHRITIYTSIYALMNNCYFYDITAAIFMQYQSMAIKRDYVIMRRTYTQVFSNRLIQIISL